MKKKLIFGSIILILTFILISIFIFQQTVKDKTLNQANHEALDVSIINLIANPSDYDGKVVRVKGVGNLQFEGNAIYLSRDDWKYGARNSLWIELSDKATPYKDAAKFNGKYVILEGTFDMSNKGHMRLHSGAIMNITRYELLKSNR